MEIRQGCHEWIDMHVFSAQSCQKTLILSDGESRTCAAIRENIEYFSVAA